MEDLFQIPRVIVAVALLNPILWELFRKDEPLTEEEWAVLEFYENLQEEEY